MAGLPALVLPCGFVDSSSAALPVGIQMIGAAFEEVGLSTPIFPVGIPVFSIKQDI